jgi:hypothetical protein
MDNYECSTTALKIPFYPLGLRFPARDVLDAVILNWTINFSRRDCLLPPVSFPLSPFSFSPFLPFSVFFLSLFSQPLYQ